MHKQIIDFVNKIKGYHPEFFNNYKYILDVGSRDVNGNNKIFFNKCIYRGIDEKSGEIDTGNPEESDPCNPAKLTHSWIC